jgi:hypothetical protein
MTRLCALSLLLFLTSCRENEIVNKNNDEPEAFQEKSIDIGRFRKKSNLIEDLYLELVDKSPELKSLETELSALNPRDTTNTFFTYDEKSKYFYQAADSYANTIRDSVLKQQILKLIKNSEDKYVPLKAELENLVDTINKKRMQINNYHTALKIALTLPLIEQYQRKHLPDKSSFEKLIEKENQLINKIETNTPKY